LLARREHSRSELARKLGEEDADPGELAALLDDLECRGWLSEQRLAEQHLARAKGRYGARRVLSDLRGKGVAGEVLERAAAQLKTSELEDARAVWRKRFGRAPADPKERARQFRFLQGRGFSAEVIRQVVGSDWDDEQG
jgi:regulatory protein